MLLNLKRPWLPKSRYKFAMKVKFDFYFKNINLLPIWRKALINHRFYYPFSGRFFLKPRSAWLQIALVIPAISPNAALSNHQSTFGHLALQSHQSWSLPMVSEPPDCYTLEWHDVKVDDALRQVCASQGWSLAMPKLPTARITLALHHASATAIVQKICRLGKLHCDALDDGWQVLLEPSYIAWQYVFHQQQVDDINESLNEGMSNWLSQAGHYHADKASNSLWIYDTPDHNTQIKAWLESIDQPSSQIKIQAFLVNIDNDYIHELGMALRQAGDQNIGGIDFNINADSDVTGVQPWVDHRSLQVHLAALERHGRAQVLSSPSVTLLNHHEASIAMGEEVPYQAMTSEGGMHYDFKDVNLRLLVRADVLPSDQIRLDLKLNQDHISETAIHGAHSIQTNRLTTTVMLKSRETLILGGLWYEDGFSHESTVPKGHFYWLRHLFSGDSQRHSQHRMLIFITPTVLTSQP